MKRFPLVFFLCAITIALFAQQRKQTKSTTTLQYADSLYYAESWERAAESYESVLRYDPSNAVARHRAGFCYHNLGDYERAVRNYTKALSDKPSPQLQSILYSHLARSYARMNDTKRALEFLEQAINFRYMNVDELKTHHDFANLRKETPFNELLRKAQALAFPCMENPQARQFDFWLGEWKVYVTGTNQLAGHSKIEIASGGCMILENWTSLRTTYSGKSMNFIDAVSGKWKQVWVGSEGIVSEFLNGTYDGNVMRFEFSTKNAQGFDQFVKFHFYNQGSNQVRQLHQTSDDNGKTWNTTYDFTYVRK